MFIDCTICNDGITNPENISVSKCGHVFHFKCLTTFVKRKPIECPACSKMISLATITQIHPTTVNRQEEECNQGSSHDTTNTEEKQPGPGKENPQKAKSKESRQINEHLESPKYENRSSDLQSPLNSKGLLHLTDYTEQMTKLKLKVKKLEVQKKRYYKRKIDLKKTSQTALDEAKKAIDDFKKLQGVITQNDAVIKNLKENNEILLKELQTLKTKLESIEKDLETSPLRTKDLTIQNEHLIKQNDCMKRHIITLKEHFSCYDSAITEFNETILNENHNKLSGQILSLQMQIKELKRKLNTYSPQESRKRTLENNNTTIDTPIEETDDKRIKEEIKTESDTTEENGCSSSMRIGLAINKLEDTLN